MPPMNDASWPDWQATKLDAARRQLETAIRLLFAQDDAVSIHTLAHASFGILKAVAEHRKERPVLDTADELAAKDGKEFWKGFNRTGNVFMHADNDPHGVLSDGRRERSTHFACRRDIPRSGLRRDLGNRDVLSLVALHTLRRNRRGEGTVHVMAYAERTSPSCGRSQRPSEARRW